MKAGGAPEAGHGQGGGPAKYILGVDVGSTVIRCYVYDKGAGVKGFAAKQVSKAAGTLPKDGACVRCVCRLCWSRLTDSGLCRSSSIARPPRPAVFSFPSLPATFECLPPLCCPPIADPRLLPSRRGSWSTCVSSLVTPGGALCLSKRADERFAVCVWGERFGDRQKERSSPNSHLLALMLKVED